MLRRNAYARLFMLAGFFVISLFLFVVFAYRADANPGQDTQAHEPCIVYCATQRGDTCETTVCPPPPAGWELVWRGQPGSAFGCHEYPVARGPGIRGAASRDCCYIRCQ